MSEEKSKKKKIKKPQITTDIDFRITSPKIKAFLLAISLIIAVMLSGYHVLRITDDPMVQLRTVTAKKITHTKTIETDAFVLRDERGIQGSGISGYAAAVVADGTKVSGNDNVVNIFRSESDARVYYELLAIEEDIAYYQSISNTTSVSTLSDISAYDDKVESSIFALIGAVEKKNISDLEVKTDAFRAAVTKRSIAVGNTVDVSGVLASLYSQRTQLLNKQSSFSGVSADVAGYYVHNADGFEFSTGVYNNLAFAQNTDVLTKNVKKIDCAAVDALLQLQPSVSNMPYGKLITGFIWYIVCNVATEDVDDFYIGQRLQVSFPDEQVRSIETKVAAMNANGAGQTALILSATAMDADYANLRQTKVVISLDSYTGIKVNNTAMRVVDGEQGVYVLLGNVIRFRRVETLYSDDDFYIVDASGKPDYIKAFDEIILGGTDLYDGKLVQ